MNSFVDYIEESCAGLRDDKILYNYKRMLYDEITERANQITASGLKDEKVLGDLIRDEYPNIKENYKSYYDAKTKKLREKRRIKLTAIGSVFTFIIMFIAYFGVSFSTHRWSNSWLIIVGGIFGLIILWLSFAIKKLCTMKKIFHPVARILTAICIMMATVFAFLFALAFLHMAKAWTIVLMGIIAMFVADAVFATVTKQKLYIINYFLYIPSIFTMLFVILGAFSVVSWRWGWLLIILGLIIDAIIMMSIAAENSRYHYHQEVEDVWNEN